MPGPNGNPNPDRTLLRVGLPLVVLLFGGWWFTQRTPSRASEPVVPARVEVVSWESLPSELSLVDDKEQGTPLVIYGQVFGADGEVVPNARITISHADASGEYGKSTENPSWPRLSGRLTTDSAGRYEVRTVKPGTSDEPPHVHIAVGRARNADQVFEIQFAADWEKVPGGAVDTSVFGTRRPETRDDSGVLRVRRDFKLP